MDWWRKVAFPVRRVWCAFSTRVKARKNGGGLLKLHDDIQTCGYEDVRIMWEMLRKSEPEVLSPQAKRKHRWFRKNFSCSNQNAAEAASPFSTNQTQ
ncbi:hypothetical protein ACJIZ3_005007 [Penstemon smallii]|uniref:Uncharacterized protein n=1 Tax=Penstemon smallii TaxID=265156 RepID=A0ABD3S3U6_9LAMI